MEKSSHSSGDSTNAAAVGSSIGGAGAISSNSRDQYLRHLNKISHRISKPTIRSIPPLDPNLILHPPHHRPQPAPPQQPPPQQQAPQSNLHPQQPPHQHQPPVYNINKSDFRDVVQKLTGSPAHERFSTPPPIHPPKPQSSRLQRIRPPPLSALGNRPPPPALLSTAPPPQPSSNSAANPNIPHGGNFTTSFRQLAPLSPLPPLPSVHGAAESPISAYMRLLHGSVSAADSDPKQFPRPLVSPRWNNPPPLPQQQQQIPQPPPALAPRSQFPMPTSPLPFGCLPSPRSPYPCLSPSLLFSPTGGQLGLPASPRFPVPTNPQWRDI